MCSGSSSPMAARATSIAHSCSSPGLESSFGIRPTSVRCASILSCALSYGRTVWTRTPSSCIAGSAPPCLQRRSSLASKPPFTARLRWDVLGRLGTLVDVSTLCVQCGPLVGVVMVTTTGYLHTPGDSDDHNRRVNLIEPQRDPQPERSGHTRATADMPDRRLSSLLAVEPWRPAGIGLPEGSDRLPSYWRTPGSWPLGETRPATMTARVSRATRLVTAVSDRRSLRPIARVRGRGPSGERASGALRGVRHAVAWAPGCVRLA